MKKNIILVIVVIVVGCGFIYTQWGADFLKRREFKLKAIQFEKYYIAGEFKDALKVYMRERDNLDNTMKYYSHEDIYSRYVADTILLKINEIEAFWRIDLHNLVLDEYYTFLIRYWDSQKWIYYYQTMLEILEREENAFLLLKHLDIILSEEPLSYLDHMNELKNETNIHNFSSRNFFRYTLVEKRFIEKLISYKTKDTSRYSSVISIAKEKLTNKCKELFNVDPYNYSSDEREIFIKLIKEKIDSNILKELRKVVTGNKIITGREHFGYLKRLREENLLSSSFESGRYYIFDGESEHIFLFKRKYNENGWNPVDVSFYQLKYELIIYDIKEDSRFSKVFYGSKPTVPDKAYSTSITGSLSISSMTSWIKTIVQ